MAVTAWKYPSALTTVSFYDVAWGNPTALYQAADSSGAFLGKFESSHRINFRDYGFTTSDVPSGATIDGIEVKTRARKSGVAAPMLILTGIADTNLNIHTIDEPVSALTASDTAYTHGSPTEDWGISGLDDVLVRSADFGASLYAYNGDPVNFASVVHSEVNVRIYYTVSGPSLTLPTETSITTTTATIGCTTDTA